MTWYRITPLDVLLFRDSRPFSPADGSWAKGLFPPMPVTVFHGLRSLLAPRTSRAARTNRNLGFLGPFLCDPQGQLWLPTPKDLVCLYPQEVGAKKASNAWEKVYRLRPAPQEPSWAHLAFDPTYPAPMVITREIHDQGKDRQIGEPLPWMRADALVAYLNGQVQTWKPQDFQAAPLFQANPWDVQIMPHIQMKSGMRQVQEADGYFTEVAVRLRHGWQFVARLDADQESLPKQGVIRLGGEGHRALVEQMGQAPSGWPDLDQFESPSSDRLHAYVLTPGLALADPNQRLYASYPADWASHLEGCATDRQLMWGGISAIARGEQDELMEVAYIPQRAFVPPGTVYVFKSLPEQHSLLPISGAGQGLDTFRTLNYGKLLWGVR